jgi:hypothetical protein
MAKTEFNMDKQDGQDESAFFHPVRGIYVLLNHFQRKVYEVVYVGMSETGVKDRLVDHQAKSKGRWTLFL